MYKLTPTIMCHQCYIKDMVVVNRIFDALYRHNYTINHADIFDIILKKLRNDACSSPNLRKYAIKLDNFTWMKDIIGYDIMDTHFTTEPDPKDYENTSPALFLPYVRHERIHLPRFQL